MAFVHDLNFKVKYLKFWMRGKFNLNPINSISECRRMKTNATGDWRMLGISYREHKTNEYVWQQVDILFLPPPLQTSEAFTVKRCKLSWFGHVYRYDRLHKEQRMVVVAEEDLVSHGRTTSRKGQASQCRNCCASRMTYVDGHCGRCICRSAHRRLLS